MYKTLGHLSYSREKQLRTLDLKKSECLNLFLLSSFLADSYGTWEAANILRKFFKPTSWQTIFLEKYENICEKLLQCSKFSWRKKENNINTV